MGGSGNLEVRSHGFSDSNPITVQAVSAPNAGTSKRSVYDKTPHPIGTGKKMEGFGNTSISYQSNNSPSKAQWQTGEVHHSRHRSSGSFTEVVRLPGSFSFRNDPDKAAQTLGSEQQIVDEICTPGGIRPAPSNEDLRKFVEKVSILEGEKVGIHLENKLADPNWQVKLRALHVLEALVNMGGTESCFMAVQHFIRNPESLEKCQDNQQMSVKEKATDVLALIGAQHSTPKAISAPPQTDLLADIAAGQATQTVQTGNQQDPFADMFGSQSAGLQVQQQTAAQSQSPINVSSEPMVKSISAELSNLSILDMSVQQSALDEVLFSDDVVQAEVAHMAPQQMYQQQQMQSQMYGAQGLSAGYDQHMTSWQQQNMMMQARPQQAGVYWQPAVQQMPMGGMTNCQNQHYSSMASVPLNSFAGKGHVAPIDRKQKKESAFDFVQDHMAGLRK
eukprot:TRINITY_DN1847_c0_g1_i5.p1 TRINITY_DN1847_c0_g1~~TRINITY_DN1847_c0_g1_i5.p1  ORF type:complete len:447 (-),score=38.86 TRINITY_DN1847_c0_g1_i5:276-1616(-)